LSAIPEPETPGTRRSAAIARELIERDGIDWEALSDEALWTAMNVALPYSSGLAYAEIAASLSRPKSWVIQRMRELRVEILAQFGLPLDDVETSRQ
jgi:hypothetical protein